MYTVSAVTALCAGSHCWRKWVGQGRGGELLSLDPSHCLIHATCTIPKPNLIDKSSSVNKLNILGSCRPFSSRKDAMPSENPPVVSFSLQNLRMAESSLVLLYGFIALSAAFSNTCAHGSLRGTFLRLCQRCPQHT